MKKIHGSLEVICGSMFSGKSEELIRRLRRAELAQLKVQVFKHTLDNRKTTDHIHAHSGSKIAAVALDHVKNLNSFILSPTQVIGIDEVQFFPSSIVGIIHQFVMQGKRIIVAGLDLDFRGLPFGCMPALLALADSVTKLKAVCMECSGDAHFTQRLVDGQPAKATDPLIMIGAQECYQARCRTCYQIDHFII
ncbi:MAG: thymidine kinase [Candidatus Babeliaceae bacterium]